MITFEDYLLIMSDLKDITFDMSKIRKLVCTFMVTIFRLEYVWYEVLLGQQERKSLCL